MKELIETGEYDCVFAWEISRIARRKKVLFSISEYLIERKIQLIVKEPYLHLLKSDGSIDEGAETIFTLYAQIAETEMRNKMARWKRAKDEGFAKGKYEGGRVTLGYKVNSDGFWEIDEEAAAQVKLIFDLYISGEYSTTTLAKELIARGYFRIKYPVSKRGQIMSVTSVKNRIWQILRNPMYRGGQSASNRNNYPQIIDDETWEKCAKKREENKNIPKARNEYLLTPLIHCKCGASYSVNLVDGCYNCRVKHNAVEKGLEHSPNIHANLIESLAWYVALLELQNDNVAKCRDVQAQNEESIKVLMKKIEYSTSIIDKLRKRREKLVDDYYVNGTLTDTRYKELTEGQNKVIAEEHSNISKYNSQIKFLQEQISDSVTFDELFDSLKGRYESLRNGTDSATMRTIVRRYIKDIKIESMEGKLTSFWKIVKIELVNSAARQQLIEKYKKAGLTDVAITLGTTFYCDCHHYIAYWDKELEYAVPMVMLDRIKKTRKENRKGRKRKPIKNHQY
jgi:DNA invertase Pin-like site-specific DNA recombinase